MDYYGLLFLYYLKGLSGKSVLRLFFNIEAGGTEQLLPENTSTPTTTPILADIQYPDGLRTDQYFTYRETPTTVSNKARIKTIKGNTLVWNQQLHLLNSTYWVQNNASVVFADGVGTFTATGATFGCYVRSGHRFAKIGHKYLFAVNVVSSASGNVNFGLQNAVSQATVNANVKTRISAIATATTENTNIICYKTSASEGDTLVVSDYIAIDLTEMFGQGNEPATVEEFTSLFPLSYYSYNQGSLLSFNGNGIKTVGKNMIDAIEQGAYSSTGTDVSGTTRLRTKFISVKPNTTYSAKISGTVSFDLLVTEFSMNDLFTQYIDQSAWTQNQITFTTLPNCYYVRLMFKDHNNTSATVTPSMATEVQLEKGSAPTSYEPYTESTLSLPITTYFPNGMKSAGSAYDELTPRKAITRIGAVDLGSINYGYNLGNKWFYSAGLTWDVAKPSSASDVPNMVSALYLVYAQSVLSADDNLNGIGITTSGQLLIRNASYTDATAFKSAMSGVYLYYELATPTETPITTEDANEALSLLMGKSVSSDNANQMINIITKGE